MSIINTIWRFFFDEEKEEEPNKIPEFQRALIELSQIPGLEITGTGIHIKGPELKKESGGLNKK